MGRRSHLTRQVTPGSRKEVLLMLGHRDRGWSRVRESLRRERRIHDVLNASSAARLSQRVATAGGRDPSWRGADIELRLIERDIRRLDPVQDDFWQRYEALERRLITRFDAAGVPFDPTGINS